MHKIYINANQLLDDAYRLGFRVLDSGYRPDLILALWRGGTPVGAAVQELLEYCGVHCEHTAIKTRHYHGIDSRAADVTIADPDTVMGYFASSQQLLIVDDVFDSGRSLDTLITAAEQQLGDAMPEVRVATVYYKPGNNRTERQPDYYLHQTEHWLVFPHELIGLRPDEIVAGKPDCPSLLRLQGSQD